MPFSSSLRSLPSPSASLRLSATLGLAVTLWAGAAQAADVGVSIRIGEPGFYGQLDIGGAPRPELIYAQPVIIHRAPQPLAPVYLRVPPGHEKHWSKHCARYNACGRPVYFVRESWYERVYAPDYRRRHDHDHDDHRGPQGGPQGGPPHGGPGEHGRGRGH